MKHEELQELIKQQTRDAIKAHVNTSPVKESEEPIEESILASMLLLGGLGAGWGWMRNFIRTKSQEEAFNEFIQKYDNKSIISNKIPDLVRRFKLVNSLTDLETMEARVDSLIGELNAMERNVDTFIADKYDSVEQTKGDKFFLLDPKKEKANIKKNLKEFIRNTKKSFELEIQQKKDEILG